MNVADFLNSKTIEIIHDPLVIATPLDYCLPSSNLCKD